MNPRNDPQLRAARKQADDDSDIDTKIVDAEVSLATYLLRVVLPSILLTTGLVWIWKVTAPTFVSSLLDIIYLGWIGVGILAVVYILGEYFCHRAIEKTAFFYLFLGLPPLYGIVITIGSGLLWYVPYWNRGVMLLNVGGSIILAALAAGLYQQASDTPAKNWPYYAILFGGFATLAFIFETTTDIGLLLNVAHGLGTIGLFYGVGWYHWTVTRKTTSLFYHMLGLHLAPFALPGVVLRWGVRLIRKFNEEMEEAEM